MTRISQTLTNLVESLMKDDDKDDEEIDLPMPEELFTVGQWVRAVVVENTAITGSSESQKKHIDLSLEPELVNASLALDDILPKTLLQISVSSVEDHGAVVSLGLPRLSGFIKKTALGGYTVDKLHEGQVFLACVEHRPKNKVVQLSLDLKATQAPIKDVSDIASLLPGNTVQCLVSEIRDAGVGGKILGMLDATIDQLHISGDLIAENKTVMFLL
jgi:rRNA biogenesis protein RRP5